MGVPTPARQHASRAIEDIRVGQRVLGENPDVGESEHSTETTVDPATWRLVRLHAEERWDDGTLDTVEVETLQPLAWIEEQRARVGRSVPIPMDLEEMGLPSDTPATVVSVADCPPIERGAGHVVLTTINHLNNSVLDLVVSDVAGRLETVSPTGLHKFYSLSRGDWVAAADLKYGEQLRGMAGPTTSTVRVIGVD